MSPLIMVTVQMLTLVLVNTWEQDGQHTVRSSFYSESPLSEELWVARMAELLKMLACKPHSKLRIQSLGPHGERRDSHKLF